MKHADPFSQRQLRTLCTVALLSPVLRLLPGAAAPLAARAAWLGPLAALPVLLFYAWVLNRIRNTIREGEGFPELTLRALGNSAGRIALLLLGSWLLLYTGFVLRAGADRFIVTVFPHSGPASFVVTMGILALLAALGPLQSLVRVARMVAPILFLTLLVILLASLRQLEPAELLPLTAADTGRLLGGSLPTVDILAFGLALPTFFRVGQDRQPGRLRRMALWAAGMALMLTAISGAVQGHFGAALSARLTVPFFTLVRNLVFFRSMERMEALVVALWIFPDFLLSGIALHAAQHCLRLAAGKAPRSGEARLDLQNGRWILWVCGAVVIGLGLLLAPDPPSLRLWSREIIPILNLVAALVLLPGIYAVGKIRKKL